MRQQALAGGRCAPARLAAHQERLACPVLQLRTLVAVLDAGSLTAAAPKVFLSQSSVSEQMR
ncbi:LysR family transcriptional regulator, partial [Paenibacillus polymyxa]|nr:LysR family transcriptional regulator [Paenibacillus polymyxa]